jgi:hypothetical protein
MTDIKLQNQLFINGEFVDAQDGRTFETINPATEEKITDVASASVADVDAAVRAARAQLEPGSEWQKMKPRDRAKVMWKLADILTARAAEIGHIETIDNGKPIFESQFVDVPAAAECLYYFAGWSGKHTGETIPVSGGRLHLHASRAGRRRRGDHSLELPAHDADVEDRPGARLRQHDDRQAGLLHLALHAQVRRVRARSRACRRES